jgi:hypothetical protein
MSDLRLRLVPHTHHDQALIVAAGKPVEPGWGPSSSAGHPPSGSPLTSGRPSSAPLADRRQSAHDLGGATMARGMYGTGDYCRAKGIST